jgi:hypothetical protein
MWSYLPAPKMAMDYWRLPQGSLMRDVLLAIRYQHWNMSDITNSAGKCLLLKTAQQY